MRRFQSILVYLPPLGASQRGLERAVKLAKHNGAALTVMDVAREKPLFLEGIFPAGSWNSLIDREDRLRVKTSWIDQEEVSFTTKVLQGRPAVEIVREVLREKHDLVIKDVQLDREDDEGLFFGSVDMRLFRNCPCPVWLVKPKKDVPFARIVAAVDPQAMTEEEHAMNAAIMELASSLAETEAATLYVVSAWLGPGESNVSPSVESWVMRQYLELAEHAARKTLDALVDQGGGKIPSDHVYFQHGNPHDVITSRASEIDADLIVMGTLARTGIPGLLMGNTAEKVLRSVSCSVLALKPVGFESPIRLEQDAPP